MKYSRITLWKMVPNPHGYGTVQSFNEGEGYEMSRDAGDCVYVIRKGDWAAELPVANAAIAEQKAPVGFAELHAPEDIPPTLDSKFAYTKGDADGKAETGQRGAIQEPGGQPGKGKRRP
jgi:hypothetical protein